MLNTYHKRVLQYIRYTSILVLKYDGHNQLRYHNVNRLIKIKYIDLSMRIFAKSDWHQKKEKKIKDFVIYISYDESRETQSSCLKMYGNRMIPRYCKVNFTVTFQM